MNHQFVLFFSRISGLCWIVCVMLRQLGDDIDVQKAGIELGRWKFRYLLVSQLTDSVSRCFGFILLVQAVSEFVVLINYSFYLAGVIESGRKWKLSSVIALVWKLKEFLYFCFLVYCPHKIAEQVTCVSVLIALFRAIVLIMMLSNLTFLLLV